MTRTFNSSKGSASHKAIITRPKGAPC
uniref:Uncharacterized protein n=1 Tax=Anguilla anguilla TaxID=7936 RepID=A0A0E9SSI4_ANGAN